MPRSFEKPAMLPLEGILVVAIEQAVAAPLCTARLVQAGARVIKIEREEGDCQGLYTGARAKAPISPRLTRASNPPCIDFKSEDGAAHLWSIVSQADILIQNLSPGALNRAGFTPQKFSDANPVLIICNISGYGDSGEAAQKRAYDLSVQEAEADLFLFQHHPAPRRVGVSVCDIGTGITAYGAILEALIKRGRVWKGESFSISPFLMCQPNGWQSPYSRRVWQRRSPTGRLAPSFHGALRRIQMQR